METLSGCWMQFDNSHLEHPFVSNLRAKFFISNLNNVSIICKENKRLTFLHLNIFNNFMFSSKQSSETIDISYLHKFSIRYFWFLNCPIFKSFAISKFCTFICFVKFVIFCFCLHLWILHSSENKSAS